MTGRIEHVRADLLDLAQDAAQEILETEELAAKKAEREGPPPAAPEEAFGVIVRERWDAVNGRRYYSGEVIGTFPGDKEPRKVWALTQDGVIAMCHRAFLESLTRNGICDADTARVRAAEANFYETLMLT